MAHHPHHLEVPDTYLHSFSALGTRLSKGAHLLDQLVGDASRPPALVDAIHALEHEADDITRDVIVKVDTSAITPFDSTEIQSIARRLDDVIDIMDGIAERVEFFRDEPAPAGATRLSEVVVRVADTVMHAADALGGAGALPAHVTAVKRLEEEGDAIYYDALRQLFAGTPDPFYVIKWKDVFDRLEDAVDVCQAAAQAIRALDLRNH